MKSNELRIGNYVNINLPITEENKIIKVSSYHIGKLQKMKDAYYPIPLTEEWLLKFGFEFRNDKNNYGWYLLVSKNRVLTWCHSKQISLEFDTEDYDYNYTLFDFNCEYVHQLQNLYFALTNEELTMK